MNSYEEDLGIEFGVFLLSDKPTTPTLTSSVADPTDGDAITLTCATTSTGITQYEFLLDGSSVSASASDTLAIGAATIGTNDGSYTCIASIDTVASDPSVALAVGCE